MVPRAPSVLGHAARGRDAATPRDTYLATPNTQPKDEPKDEPKRPGGPSARAAGEPAPRGTGPCHAAGRGGVRGRARVEFTAAILSAGEGRAAERGAPSGGPAAYWLRNVRSRVPFAIDQRRRWEEASGALLQRVLVAGAAAHAPTATAVGGVAEEAAAG